MRNGCASGHDGKVLVEYRECTRASLDANRDQSLVHDRAARQRGEIGAELALRPLAKAEGDPVEFDVRAHARAG
jgi:hypothetical protein